MHRAIPETEIPRLLDALPTDADRLLCRVLLATGLRIHEACALTVGDITYPDGSVRESVRLKAYKGQGTPKADPDAQVIYVSAALREELSAHVIGKAGHEPLFRVPSGERMYPDAVGRLVAAASRRAGIGPYQAHDLRHTYATRLVHRGVGPEVQMLCRHASIVTTLRYTHPSPDRLTAAVEAL